MGFFLSKNQSYEDRDGWEMTIVKKKEKDREEKG